MQIQDDDLSNGVILEEIRDQNRAILEGLTGLKDVPTKIDSMANDMFDLKNDMIAVKAVVKYHEGRITELDTA